MEQRVTKGRSVFYTFVNGRGRTVTRPATVVEVHDDRDPALGTFVNLQVLTDGPNDAMRNDGRAVSIHDRAHNVLHVENVPYDSRAAAGTWAWPPRVG
jgi:hypothetical protein